jgi:glutathione S-transferase
VSEAAEDFRSSHYRALYGDDASKAKAKADLLETNLHRKLGEFNRLLEQSGGPYFAGANVTFGDFDAYDAICQAEALVPGSLERYHALSAFVKAIESRPHIAEYLASGTRFPAQQPL